MVYLSGKYEWNSHVTKSFVKTAYPEKDTESYEGKQLLLLCSYKLVQVLPLSQLNSIVKISVNYISSPLNNFFQNMNTPHQP